MELTLSENIRSLRKQRHLTQEQLAEVLGVTAGAVYKWESGLSVPELDLIVEMADIELVVSHGNCYHTRILFAKEAQIIPRPAEQVP